jgi:hypothetical protein
MHRCVWRGRQEQVVVTQAASPTVLRTDENATLTETPTRCAERTLQMCMRGWIIHQMDFETRRSAGTRKTRFSYADMQLLLLSVSVASVIQTGQQVPRIISSGSTKYSYIIINGTIFG